MIKIKKECLLSNLISQLNIFSFTIFLSKRKDAFLRLLYLKNLDIFYNSKNALCIFIQFFGNLCIFKFPKNFQKKI